MKKPESDLLETSVIIAKAILHTRPLRRKLGLVLLIVIMTLFSLGVFVLEDWLESNAWLFTSFWAAIFVLTCLLAMLAIYDGLRAMQEVKAEHAKSMAEDMRNIAQLLKDAQEDEKKEAERK